MKDTDRAASHMRRSQKADIFNIKLFQWVSISQVIVRSLGPIDLTAK